MEINRGDCTTCLKKDVCNQRELFSAVAREAKRVKVESYGVEKNLGLLQSNYGIRVIVICDRYYPEKHRFYGEIDEERSS